MMTNDFILIPGGIMPKKTKITGTAKPKEIETAYKECRSCHHWTLADLVPPSNGRTKSVS